MVNQQPAKVTVSATSNKFPRQVSTPIRRELVPPTFKRRNGRNKHIPEAFPRGGFWAGEVDELVFDENGFFDIPLPPADDGAVIGNENFPVSISQTIIDMPNVFPLENSLGFRLPAGLENTLSIGSSVPIEFLKTGDGSAIQEGIVFQEGNKLESYGNTLSIGSSVPLEFLKIEDNKLQSYEEDSCIPMDETLSPHSKDQLLDKKNENVALTSSHSHAPIDVNNTRVSSALGEDIDNVASDKGGWKNITWGSYEEAMEALLSSASSYELLYDQSLIPKPQTEPRKKETKKPNTNATQKANTSSKSTIKQSTGKEPLHGFPGNVKILTGTGIFDEALVRYVSTSGKELPGVISGPGYFCGCESCNFIKLVSAEEFERHAGFKTSHPNNHILFANGKSMHQVVQELKATPLDMLFDAILTVTGSLINEKAFTTWKGKLLKMGDAGLE